MILAELREVWCWLLQLTLLQDTPDVAFAMNHSEYTDRVNVWLINDQVGVEREKQDALRVRSFRLWPCPGVWAKERNRS